MVDVTLYVPNADGTNWQAKGRESAMGKGNHAEQKLWEGLRNTPAVVLFVQDQAPCGERCAPFFRKASLAGTSFIFRISGDGYPVMLQTGDQVSSMHLHEEGRRADAVFDSMIKQGFMKLPGHVPLTLFYLQGTAYVDVIPANFPAHPPLPAY